MPFNLFQRLERRFGPRDNGLTRREMLKASAAAGAALLLSNSLGFAASRAAGKRVLVIGGGFGGMSAAWELNSAGYEVTLVEARDRFGGRVRTLDRFIKDKTVEAGGEFVGANHPTWAAYAHLLGIKFREIVYDKDAEAPIMLGEERLNPGAARRLWREMGEALSMINADAAKVDAYQPWKSADAAKLDARSTASWIESLPVSDQCKQAVTIQLTSINGMIPAWQSYLANLAMVKGGGLENYWTKTDSLFVNEGNQQLAEEIADELGAEKIILATAATAIKVDSDSVTVTLSDGRQLEADDVILAVPCSTWNRIAFEPVLPAVLVPQMGTNTKYLVAVKSRFWEQEKLSHRSLTDGPISLTWEATNGQAGNVGACLTAYAGGRMADQAMAWSVEERQAKYLEILDQLYPGIEKHLMKADFVNWHNDPLARGSYSFPAPGQVMSIGPILEKGLGRLHFAGEHCCPAFVGYMEGALQSGVRLARRLAERDGIVKPERRIKE
ncbi:MAG TPA: FAD-dependent oxidoreductase [Planctomycetaceae bacterium]